MQVFIARNGNKSGPFPVWDIRAQLEEGELDPKTLGWHEGMDSWKPLHKIDAIGYRKTPPADSPANIIEEAPKAQDLTDNNPPNQIPPATDTPPSSSSLDQSSPEPEPSTPPSTTNSTIPTPIPFTEIPQITAFQPPPIIRRFWARIFDALFYLVVVMAFTRMAGIPLATFLPISTEFQPMAYVSAMLATFLLEAWLLSTFATTPGKWLLGMRIEEAGMGGKQPPFRRALQRVFLFFLCGWGLGVLGVFVLILWIYHAYSVFKHGQAFWDRRLGLRITSFPINFVNILIFAAAGYALTQVFVAIGGDELQAIIEQLQTTLEQQQSSD